METDAIKEDKAEKWRDEFPEGTRVRTKGLGRLGMIAPIPEDDKDRFQPWHAPVLWDGNSRVVAVVFFTLEIVSE